MVDNCVFIALVHVNFSICRGSFRVIKSINLINNNNLYKQSFRQKKYSITMFVCLFVFRTKTSYQLALFEVDNGLQLRMRDNTQSVLRDCSAFFSSQPTTLCCAMLPNCQPLRRHDLTQCKGQGTRLRCSLRQITIFFRHPIPGVVSNLTQLLLIARYLQQSREIRHHLNNE